ncbi:MAG TPA: DUF4230 domain-containing protein [Acidimicrobiia bacterium]|nr:DUF4230 domain-containing protein [Acidimicrobiia bacterium]HEV3452482.1 DUF4230 domain-containing protein [Acidimicrobiia bacterium]
MPALDTRTHPRIARSGAARGRPPQRGRRRSGAPVTTTVAAHPTGLRTAGPARPRRGRGATLAITAGALTAGLVTGATMAVLGVDVMATTGGPDSAAALRAVRRLGTVGPAPQALTVTFTIDNGSVLPGFGETVTYRAVGTVAVAVDLGRVGAGDIRLDGSHATVRIPPARLASPVVDDANSGVIRRNEGLITRFVGGDVSASDLRDAATSHLTEKAQEQGLLAAAQQVASADVRAALRPIGVTAVVVNVAPAS